jgi:hypothetical protein
MDSQISGWKQFRFKFVCLSCWRSYVFCHADRGANSTGTIGLWHGAGACTCFALSRASSISSIIGTKKTLVYIVLVIIMATISGLIYGFVVK